MLYALLAFSRSPFSALDRQAGPLIALGLLAGISATWWDAGLVLAGGLYWLALMGLWPRLNRRTRLQVLVMLAVGALGFASGILGGARPEAGRLLTANAPLLTMLAGVSYLALVARPVNRARLPRGRRGLVSTLAGIHLFGAVINMSALFILGDRIGERGRLERRQVTLLGRGFAVCAFWSPFFAAMAVALSVAPQAQLTTLWMMGIPLALLALGLTAREVARLESDSPLVGYPLDYGGLFLPLLLAVGVLVVHTLYPGWSILAVISLLAPLVCLALLLPRGRAGLARLGEHQRERLPQMGNELGLFLAAGVLSQGLALLIGTLDTGRLFNQFGPWQASASLLAMLGLARIGIHPLISISLLGPLVAPLDPDPNLLAMLCLATWGLGVAVGPLSGVHLALQGRYGVEARLLVRWNLGYVARMVIAVVGVFHLYAAWRLS